MDRFEWFGIGSRHGVLDSGGGKQRTMPIWELKTPYLEGCVSSRDRYRPPPMRRAVVNEPSLALFYRHFIAKKRHYLMFNQH